VSVGFRVCSRYCDLKSVGRSGLLSGGKSNVQPSFFEYFCDEPRCFTGIGKFCPFCVGCMLLVGLCCDLCSLGGGGIGG
jgi:hypothetical protein